MTQPQQNQQRYAANLLPSNANDLLDDEDFLAELASMNDDLPDSPVNEHTLESARDDALDSAREMAEKRDDVYYASLVKDGGNLAGIKQKLRESRKPRLRTVEQYLCDSCDGVIAEPTDGFIVHGNIYVADPSCLGGLIGNNFPEDGGKAEDVKKTVYCKKCFLNALGIGKDVSKELTAMLNQGRPTRKAP
jgi:uncharacterized protein YlaI